MCPPEGAAGQMQMETKFLRLRTPVEFGSRFGDWQVCWLGGWARFRLYYLVDAGEGTMRNLAFSVRNER